VFRPVPAARRLSEWLKVADFRAFPTVSTAPTGNPRGHPRKKNDDCSGLRAWLRALPPLDPVCGPAVEAEERAAIESEACGEFGPPKQEAEHRAEVAALLLGFERHRLQFFQGDRQMLPAPVPLALPPSAHHGSREPFQAARGPS
jgi:hypothetical protein